MPTLVRKKSKHTEESGKQCVCPDSHEGVAQAEWNFICALLSLPLSASLSLSDSCDIRFPGHALECTLISPHKAAKDYGQQGKVAFCIHCVCVIWSNFEHFRNWKMASGQKTIAAKRIAHTYSYLPIPCMLDIIRRLPGPGESLSGSRAGTAVIE